MGELQITVCHLLSAYYFAAGRLSTALLHLHGVLPGPGAFWKGGFPSDAWDFTETVPEYGLVLLYLWLRVDFNNKNTPTYLAEIFTCFV